jgi:hypothetical protein
MGLSSKLQLYSIGLMAAAVFCSSAAFGTVTLLGLPTGASAVIKATNGDVTNPTTTLTIYAGFAGTCSTTDNLTVCDSCDGTPIVDGGGTTFTTAPCNLRNAYNSLKLHIELTVNNSAVTGTPNLYLEVNSKNLAGAATYSYAGTTLSVFIPWSDICGASGNSTDCTTQNLSDELTIGVKGVTGGTGTGTDDTMTIPFKTRSLSVVNGGAANDTTAWFYQDCPPNGLAGKSNEGFCHFSTYKGDSKIYADELGVPTSYPSVANSTIKYDALVFFYEEQTGGESDAQTVARITTKSPRSVIAVSTNLSPPLSDNRVTGLKNGSRYCFVMANQDASGVISYFTPTQTTTPTPVLVGTMCGTPEKVVGLLDDKSCFIATAAFGSDMAPEVQSFRDFRNKYLFSSSAGKEFVRFYYKHSPFYANLIAQNDVSRATVRVALWPLLLFAKVSANFGLWAGILLLLSTAGLIVFAYRRVNPLRQNRSKDQTRGLA